jgi:hypothetical protein
MTRTQESLKIRALPHNKDEARRPMRFRPLVGIGLLVLVALFPRTGSAGSDARQKLSAAIGAMRFVRGLDRVPPFPRDLKRATARVKTCRSALASARAAGVRDSEEIDVRNNRKFPGARSVRSGRGFMVVGRVGNTASYCGGIAKQIEVARASAYISHAHHRTNRLRSRRARTPELVLEVRRAGQQCKRKVEAARAAGAPASAEIALGSVKVRVGDAINRVCNTAIRDADQAAKAMLTNRAEQLAPYKSALDPARWSAFSENLLFGSKVYVDTRDGRVEASSPAHYAGAKVWFEVYENWVLQTEWVVRRYEFAKGRPVSVRVSRGKGNAPRASTLR